MKFQYQLFFILITLFYYLISQITCVQCPDIKVLIPYKSRTWIVEGVQIYNSTIRLLRGTSALGSTELINNIMVWDSSTNHVLKIFELDLQISKMIYSKIKRKLFIAGTHKILEIHPLTFQVLNEHNVGGTTMNDIEYSESQILISRDEGNPFIYDIYLKQIIVTLPNSYLNFVGVLWAYIATLKDFTLLIVGRLIVFDINDNYQFIAYLQEDSKGVDWSRACSFQNQNVLITSNYDDKIQLGFLQKDQQGETQYILQDKYQEIYQTSDPIVIRAQDLYCVQKGNDNYVIFTIAKQEPTLLKYKGVTVLKINESVNPTTQKTSYKFSLQEKWKYRRWRQDLDFFLFDESAQRGQTISEYEHYSFEFLESDVGQCDFDDDGIIDSYCRMAKTITHWRWNLNLGVYFLGKNSEYFFYGQDKQKGYQIRDWNQTEILRFQLPRLISRENNSIQRVIQHDESSYKLPDDTYVLKMCWLYSYFSEMKNGHTSNAGFYIYQHNSFDDRKIETYNLINYMNPYENTEKYKNPFVVNSAFTYGNELHICLSYTILEININPNGDNIDNNKSYQYFSKHNKECYKLKDEKVINFYQLKLNDPIVYGQGRAQYTKCIPYFEGGQLICRNPKPMLEFWSLDNYSLVKTFELIDCTGNYDIAVHRNKFFIGCENSIIIYDTSMQKIKNFITYHNKIPQFIKIVKDILEILIYDLRPDDGSAVQSLHYQDPEDCCIVYSVDINNKKVMIVSDLQISYIDLTPCLEDPKNCIQCEINAYFSYDPNFSFLKQKYERASWPVAQPQFYVNPKFLDSGLGTIDNPYLTDMNIIQLYFKTNSYKQNIVNFKSILLNLYIDVNKPQQYMSNHFVDWTHDKTKVNLKPWDGTINSTDKTGNKIKIVINSAKNFNLTFDNWNYLDFQNIYLVCPNCKSSSLKFQNSGEVYIRNSKISLDIKDLIEPSQGELDTRILPNIRISVENVNTFILQNQQILDTKTDDLNTIPFFNFINCGQVNLQNLLFSNITNKESFFESDNSNIFLENIVFTKINTCIETDTKRQKLILIPFQNLIANNITFFDNQFCDISLFQKLVSSNSILEDQLIKISDIQVINNRFDKYESSNILFLKVSLTSSISSTQSIEINNIQFEKNYGSVNSQTNCYYFELNQMPTVLLSQITIIDEELVGIGYFNRLQKLDLLIINFLNSQYLPTSEVAEKDRKKLTFKQNLILISDIYKLKLENMKLNGIETKGVITIQVEDNSDVDLKSFTIQDCSFLDSLLISIQNLNRQISSLSISDSLFQDINIITQQSHIQVGILWVRAEKSQSKVILKNNFFNNNYLSVNQNTQKKSSISFSIDNSISDLIIKDCNFSNKYASSNIGDLFLNVQTLNILNSKFNQNLSNLINISGTKYIQEFIELIELSAMKCPFISIQAEVINISNCTFSNAISSEGTIQMFPNNNDLIIQLEECNFSNLFSSVTGTAVFVSSITSPANININNCHFNNLWSGRVQKYEKAHLYFESNPSYKNTIKITNLNVQNVGVITLNNPLASSFIYQTGFTISLSSSIIKQLSLFRGLQLDKKLKYFSDQTNRKRNSIKNKQNFKNKNQEQNTENQYKLADQNRLLLQNQQILFEILKDQKFYGSCLIHSIQGVIQLNDLKIEGNALINNQFISRADGTLQPNILRAERCEASINNLKISNFKVNKIGGVIALQDSQLSIFKQIQFENVYFDENVYQEDFSLFKEIGAANALINCIQTDCSFSNFDAVCLKSGNKCQGRILNLQEGSFNIANSLFENYYLEKQNGTAIFVFNPKNQFSISKSNFRGLLTQSSGGGIYLYQNNNKIQPILTISENKFENNSASKNGGAISLESQFIQSEEKLNITNNQFINNKADISGAVYYSSYYFNHSFIKLNQFQNNNAKMGNDIFSQPSGIHLVFENNNSSDILYESQNDTSITIKHGSGLLIPKFFVNLIYYDIQNEQKIADPSIFPQQKEILSIDLSLDNQNPVIQPEQNQISDYYITGNLQSQYDQDKNQIYFQNVQLYGKEGTTIYLSITSLFIKKVQAFDQQGFATFLPFRFIIKVIFRECSKFEIITNHSIPLLSKSTKKCQICPDLSYSKNKDVCEQCPIGANCREGEELIVQPGYWRQSYNTYSIIPCQVDFEGCIGGKSVSNDLCLEGYIGPMCQECDIFNQRGNGKFSHLSKFQCRSCDFSYLEFLVILSILALFVILASRSIRSNTSFIKGQILIKFLKIIKFKRIRKIERFQNQNILIKILMTYFQLIGIIRTLKIKVPNFLPEMSFYIGSPSTTTIINISCILPEYLGELHYIYYTFFLTFLVPFIHFIVLTVVLKTISKIRKEIFSICDLKAAIIFLFTYFQPEFIYSAIQIITCIDIDKKSYNQALISQECNIQISYIVIISLIIIILGLVVPIILYKRLTYLHNDLSFKNSAFQLKYSHYAFLSINYRHHMYYWEFIRMGERLAFILIAAIFNSQQALKIIILVFITQGYNLLLRYKKPFKNDKFNKLEVFTNSIITVSFILAIGVHTQELGEKMDIFFYIVFLFINWLIVCYMILLILQEIIYKIIDIIMIFVDKHLIAKNILLFFLNLLQKVPFFKLTFDLKVYLNKQKKPHLYNKIRQTLLQIHKTNPLERHLLFLSIKEKRTQSLYFTSAMNQIQEQHKAIKMDQSKQQNSPKNFSTQIQQIFESCDKNQNYDSPDLVKYQKRLSNFKLAQDNFKLKMCDEQFPNIRSNIYQSEKSIFSEEDQVQSPKQSAKTRNTSFCDIISERGVLENEQSEKIQIAKSPNNESVHQLFKDKGIKIKK